MWPSTSVRAVSLASAACSNVAVGERLADHRRVVAELTDLGGGLVHDAQDPVDDANRAGAKAGIARTTVDLGGDHRIVKVERMVVNEDVQASAIAAADLADRSPTGPGGSTGRPSSDPVCIAPPLRWLTTSAARSRSR